MPPDGYETITVSEEVKRAAEIIKGHDDRVNSLGDILRMTCKSYPDEDEDEIQAQIEEALGGE